jgi:hypothetical protein
MDLFSPQSNTSPNGMAKRTDESTGSDVNLSLAKIWLQDCLLSHENCMRSSTLDELPVLPTRVIDATNPENCFLFETNGRRDNYLTLSYCWGQGERLLTTKQCYEAFQQRLPMNDQMPRTFREAFTVTRALGYRYIWIDALCIIQDNPQDLNKEMARMGDIYQNSTVTISAEKGPDTDSGLFASRNGPFYKPCNTTIEVIEHDEHRKREVAFVSPPAEYDHINPLSKRGWVRTDVNPDFIRTDTPVVGTTGANSCATPPEIHASRDAMDVQDPQAERSSTVPSTQPRP